MTAAPVPETVPSALGNDFGWALGVLFRAYLKTATSVTSDVPGGPRGYQVLTAAAKEEAGTQLALAQRLGIDRTVMTYLLDDLEKAGLVTRRPDPADRRARRVVATGQGREFLGQLDTRLARAEEHILAGLPDGERATFRELLQRLAGHVNAVDPVANSCSIAEDIASADPSC